MTDPSSPGVLKLFNPRA